MIQLPPKNGRRYAVLGLGRSGGTAARALAAAGAEVLAWDDAEASRQRLAAESIETRPLDAVDWRGIDGLVLSPGIPHSFPKPHPATAAAQAAGVPLISDVALLIEAEPEARFVGITGTNGKSTTTALIGHILKAAGRPAAVGGNLGIPVLSLESPGAGGIYVLELSSYQLELVPALACDVAILLNITPDHLDRHGGLEGYAAAKKRIFTHQHAGQTAIVGIDTPLSARIAQEIAEDGPQRVLPLSVERALPEGLSVRDGQLFEGATPLADFSSLERLPGRHNWQNAAAAYAACRPLGLSQAEIAAGLASFPGLAHRQELLGRIAGVRFVNDSKATNAEAAATALTSYPTIYWIAGGRAKDGGIDSLAPLLGPVREVFLIGEAEEAFAAALDGKRPCLRCGTLEAATAAAFRAARRDGLDDPAVLLSPACASFDQFPDFEARGEAFRKAFEALSVEVSA